MNTQKEIDEKTLHFYAKTLEDSLHMFQIILEEGQDGVYSIYYINNYTGKRKYLNSITPDTFAQSPNEISQYIIKQIEIAVQYENIEEDVDRLRCIRESLHNKGIFIPF